MTMATLKKERVQLASAYSFVGLVHCHHGEKHDNTERTWCCGSSLRILHPDPQSAGKETLGLP